MMAQQQQYYEEEQDQAAEGVIIDEVSPEQEDGESQNQQFNNRPIESNIMGQLSNIAEDLSTE